MCINVCFKTFNYIWRQFYFEILYDVVTRWFNLELCNNKLDSWIIAVITKSKVLFLNIDGMELVSLSLDTMKAGSS